MIKRLFAVLLAFSTASFAAPTRLTDSLKTTTRKIEHEILANGKAYSDLTELTSLGHRLSGSEGAAKAVEWAKRKMESYGFDHVVLQPVMVPHWTRGNVERATLLTPNGSLPLKVAALGGSIGTTPSAVEAEVIEVQGLKDVEKLGDFVRGKIVFYNRAMDPKVPNTFDAYGATVDQRMSGPSRAAKFGAVGVLVRSLTTLPDDDHPHTGAVHYEDGVAMIPAAAISSHGANLLSRNLKQNPGSKLKLELSAQRNPLVPSYNVMGEITGAELPNEYVVVGGHLDSWDLATGAHDDGAGVVQSIEALRSLKALGIRPKRTVRAVLFMAEELGIFGGKEYAKQIDAKKEKHLAAIESDCGGFEPLGFGVEAKAGVFDIVKTWAPYLASLHADRILNNGESGADVSPLAKLGVATFGLMPESKHYFDFHHSALDRIEAVKPGELKAGAAAMAVFAYLLSERGLAAEARL